MFAFQLELLASAILAGSKCGKKAPFKTCHLISLTSVVRIDDGLVRLMSVLSQVNRTPAGKATIVTKGDRSPMLALSRGTTKGMENDKEVTESHRSLHVFQKLDGRWQVVAIAQLPVAK